MIEVLLILVALALVVACGAFVAAELAFVTVDRSSVERAAEEATRRRRASGSAACPRRIVRLGAAWRF